MKITVDGHGGHLCEAYLDDNKYSAIGCTIEEAIGRLILQCFDVEILPCETTAYDRSQILWQNIDRKIVDIHHTSISNGVTTITSLSPYNVPVAIKINKDSIQYKYLGEISQPVRTVEANGSTFLLGKNVERLYQLKSSNIHDAFRYLIENAKENYLKETYNACHLAYKHYNKTRLTACGQAL